MNKAQKDWCETVLWSFVHGAALNLGLADSKDSDDSALYREMMICISTFDRVGEGARWKVTLEQETDGRWIGEVESVPGALAYGETKEEAAVKAAEIARAASEPNPHEYLLELIDILARPIQDGGEGMADNQDSPLMRLREKILSTKELAENDSESLFST